MRKKLISDKFGLKILAFVIAFFLWLIVVNIDDPIMTKTFNDIPVSVINEEVLSNAKPPQTYQIVDDTQKVNVTVTAKRKVLNSIQEKDIQAIADMKELNLDSQIPLEIKISKYEGNYNSAVAKPSNLQIKLEDEDTKVFPIVATTTGSVRDGYALGDVKASPEKVTIRGPKSAIESIARVEASASVTGISKDSKIDSNITLYNSDNEEIDQSHLANNLGTDGVTVDVEVLHTKEVNLHFDTSYISTKPGYEFNGITYEPQTIIVAGTQEELANIDTIYIPASALKVGGLTEKREQTVTVDRYLPRGIRLANEDAKTVVVTIGVAPRGTRSFDVSIGTITVKNLDSQLSMNYTSSDALEVQVRGPKEVLDSLPIEQELSIDLKKCTEPGIYKVPVNANLPKDCALVNQLEIEVELTKKE